MDVFTQGGFSKALSTDKGTSSSGWRGNDWTNVGGYAVLVLVRVAVVAGVGLGKQGRSMAKTA